MFPNDQELLVVRQRHDAKRAGLHYDIRMVVGDKAYSWSTKKDMPKPGESIILHQQPVHDASYALSQKIEIPKGQYGYGTTTLDWVKKGRVSNREDSKDKFVIETDGERYLVRHVPSYGEKMWLFKNIGSKIEKKASDMSVAEESMKEEQKAVTDYKSRLKDAVNPKLREAIEHAKKEEVDHAKDFKEAIKSIEKKANTNRYLEKIAKDSIFQSTPVYFNDPNGRYNSEEREVFARTLGRAKKMATVGAALGGITGVGLGSVMSKKHKILGKILGGAVGTGAGFVTGTGIGLFSNSNSK